MRIGEPCKLCLRPITRKVLAEKRAVKVANALASLRKAKANGSKLGRPKAAVDAQVLQLRKQGLTIRAIAKEIGKSTTVVQRCLK